MTCLLCGSCALSQVVLEKGPTAAPWHYHLFSLFLPTLHLLIPPPQPVTYLYPGDSGEPIRAAQIPSDTTMSVNPTAHRDLLSHLQPRLLFFSGFKWGKLKLWLLEVLEMQRGCGCSPPLIPLRRGPVSGAALLGLLDAACARGCGALELLTRWVEVKENTLVTCVFWLGCLYSYEIWDTERI